MPLSIVLKKIAEEGKGTVFYGNPYDRSYGKIFVRCEILGSGMRLCGLHKLAVRVASEQQAGLQVACCEGWKMLVLLGKSSYILYGNSFAAWVGEMR